MNVDAIAQHKSSGNKNLSTEESRNDVHLVPMNTGKREDFSDADLRLFTFMNNREEDLKRTKELKCMLGRKKSTKQCKRKSFKKLSYPNDAKEQNSGLIQMIEESRKKREDFLKLIIDEQPVPDVENQRRCKTPTGLKNPTIRTQMTPLGKTKKSQTPRGSLACAFQNKSPKNCKLFRARSSLGSFSQTKNTPKIVATDPKQHKNPTAQKKTTLIPKKQTNERQLLKKKQQLEKQLLQINQSLLLKKNPKGTNKQNRLKPSSHKIG